MKYPLTTPLKSQLFTNNNRPSSKWQCELQQCRNVTILLLFSPVVSAVFQGGLFGVSGMMPPKYTGAVMTGQVKALSLCQFKWSGQECLIPTAANSTPYQDTHCSDEGLTLETSAITLFTAFSISTSTLGWYIVHFTATPTQTKSSSHRD